MMANQIDDKPSLPKEYVQLEWLGSDSSAYIDTGIGGDYDNFTIDVQFTYNQYVRYGAVYGNYVNDNTNSWRCILSETNNYVIVNCNTISTTRGNTTIPCGIDNIHILNVSKSLITIDDITFTPNKSYGISNNSNIILFNRGNNTAIRDIGLKIYYFKIYDDKNIILNLIPALRIADLKPGMYDLVSGQFFVNRGTGEFVFPDIPDTQKPYLCFEAVEDDFSVCLGGDFHEHTCQYSFNRIDWFDLPARTHTPSISISQKVYFRANLTPIPIEATKPNEVKSIGYFLTTKKCRLSGNPTSMLHGMDWALGNLNTSVPNYGLSNLFINTMSVSVSKDFFNFTSVLTRACYNMFFSNKYLVGSIYITKAAGANSTGSAGVFMGAFTGCKLDSVFIETNESAWQTYQNAFESSLIKTLNLPATFIHPGMYYYTCKNCTYLEKVFINGRKLNISSVSSYTNHLNGSFLNCSRLSTVTYLVINPFDKRYTNNWLKGVAEEGTIILNKNITWNPEDYRNGNIDNIEGSATLGETITWGIPAGWEVKYCDPDNPDDVRDNKEDFC